MTDIKMLPCPFCGGQVFIHHGHRDIGYVTCGQRDDGSDGCGVVASFRPNKGGREATAAWNRRATAARDAEIEALRRELDRLRGEHVRVRRDRNAAQARAERLAEALRMMVENADDLVAYRHDEDDIGDRPCCQVASYEPHADHCPTHIARAALRDHD